EAVDNDSCASLQRCLSSLSEISIEPAATECADAIKTGGAIPTKSGEDDVVQEQKTICGTVSIKSLEDGLVQKHVFATVYSKSAETNVELQKKKSTPISSESDESVCNIQENLIAPVSSKLAETNPEPRKNRSPPVSSNSRENVPDLEKKILAPVTSKPQE